MGGGGLSSEVGPALGALWGGFSRLCWPVWLLRDSAVDWEGWGGPRCLGPQSLAGRERGTHTFTTRLPRLHEPLSPSSSISGESGTKRNIPQRVRVTKESGAFHGLGLSVSSSTHAHSASPILPSPEEASRHCCFRILSTSVEPLEIIGRGPLYPANGSP